VFTSAKAMTQILIFIKTKARKDNITDCNDRNQRIACVYVISNKIRIVVSLVAVLRGSVGTSHMYIVAV